MRRELDFPSNPNDRYTGILSTFNIGPKAITLFLIPEPEYYITPPDLRRSFQDIFRGSEMAKAQPNTSQGYCHRSLIPIGLVAEEVELPVSDVGLAAHLVGYAQTEDGHKYGPACAAKVLIKVLIYEYQHERSLYTVLGPTYSNSEKTRAPSVRANILTLLDKKKKPVRRVDISDELGLDQTTVGHNLVALAKVGAIIYEAVDPATGKIKIEFTKGSRPFKDLKVNTRVKSNIQPVIADICLKLLAQNIPISQSRVFSLIPDTFKKERTADVIKHHINWALNFLTESGYLSRIKFRKDMMSQAQITKDGRTVAKEVLYPSLDILSDGDELAKSKEDVAQVTRKLGKYAAATAHYYYPYSKSSLGQLTGKRVNHLLNQLGSSPTEGSTITQLSRRSNLPPGTTRTYLLTLERRKQVRRRYVNGVDRWYRRK